MRSADLDDDTSPYSLSHPPGNKFHYHAHNNSRDYTSGLFKWKRASGIPEVTRRMGKERVEDEPPDPRVVDAHISRCLTDAANFCRAPSHPDDWRQVHALGDLIHASETNSKEAVRSLRHELRSREVYVQRRAVRAWGIWSLSSGGIFGTYAANTQLLGILEDMLSNSLTPREVRDDLLEVLSALAFRVRTNETHPVQNFTASSTGCALMGASTPGPRPAWRGTPATCPVWRKSRLGAC